MKKFFTLILVLNITALSSLSFGWGKKTKHSAPTEPVEITEYDNHGSGYVGTLPDITNKSSAEDVKSNSPLFEKTKKFNSSEEIKPVPRDNPAFVNIILKTDKISPYLNDINEVIPQLENILTCIENNYDVQKFNAKVFFFNQTVKFLQEKYEGKPESNLTSFKKLTTLSTHTQSVATLRAEAEKYRPYLAYTGAGYLYNDNVINQQLDYLKTEIEDTISLLKEAE